MNKQTTFKIKQLSNLKLKLIMDLEDDNELEVDKVIVKLNKINKIIKKLSKDE